MSLTYTCDACEVEIEDPLKVIHPNRQIDDEHYCNPSCLATKKMRDVVTYQGKGKLQKILDDEFGGLPR